MDNKEIFVLLYKSSEGDYNKKVTFGTEGVQRAIGKPSGVNAIIAKETDDSQLLVSPTIRLQ